MSRAKSTALKAKAKLPTVVNPPRASNGARFSWISSRLPNETVVQHDDALSIDVVFACVRVLAEAVASLPLDLMRRAPDGSATVADEHPAHEAVHWEPNDEQTSYDLRFWMMVDSLLRGCGYAYIDRSDPARIQLWPLLAREMKVLRDEKTNALLFLYGASQKSKGAALLDSEVLRIPFFPFASAAGQNLVELQNGTLAAAKDANDHAGEYFSNGAIMKGIVEVAETLPDDAYARLKADWNESYNGRGRRFQIPLLEGGAKFNQIALNPEETQLLETRKFTRSQISGMFRVPAHMINDLEKATFSNIEHQDLAFVKHTLTPWLVNWEQRLRRSLLTPQEKRTLFFKHNLRSLLRGDTPSRFAAYGTAIQNGFMSPNDARRAEDMNAYEGGDAYFINGALRPTAQPYGAPPVAPDSPATQTP